MQRIRPVQLAAVVGVAIAVLIAAPTTSAGAAPRVVSGPVAPTASPDRVVLNPTASPHDSQTFTWRTDVDTVSGAVEIGRVGEVATRRVDAQHRTRGQHWHGAMHHSATVGDLEESTAYRYRVGSDVGGWSPWYEFTTAASDLRPWSFLYFGDAQNDLGDVWPAVTGRRAFAEHPDAALALHAGDLINHRAFATFSAPAASGVIALPCTAG